MLSQLGSREPRCLQIRPAEEELKEANKNRGVQCCWVVTCLYSSGQTEPSSLGRLGENHHEASCISPPGCNRTLHPV